ncbi:cytochrome c [Flavobacterium sp.]|jgi:cytochrome c5|uniref:cytochrome c n=1 Tax=Flavobacterium sp. TaxID=239 RepID=UPI0037BFE412
MKSSVLIGLVVVSVVVGCAPKKVVVTEETPVVKEIAAEKLEITAEVIAEGKNLYTTSCADCHSLYEKESFTAEQWKPIVIRMQKNTKLTDLQREKIYAYLTTPQF